MPSDSSKRKDPPTQNGAAQARVKRPKTWDARQIRTEPSHKALNERKELDVGSFVKSHEFEIRALEQGIVSSKSALSQRAFQQVPRQLRRRTASHNVKKVPKRLRARAAREMKEDNTPSQGKKVTGKQRLRVSIALSNAKAGADNSSSTKASKATDSATEAGEPNKAPILVRKHKKRQLKKAWLPTHLFHAKRAHMTPPMKPLWDFAIALTPTEKSYRPTHRGCTLRGCVAWDMSYMSTIQLDGPEQSITAALEKLSAPGSNLSSAKLRKWRQGKQTRTDLLYRSTDKKPPIAPATIIWNPQKVGAESRQVLIRVHPAAFSELLAELQRIRSKQQPSVEIRDMRFEFGTIEVAGPASTEAIIRTLQPREPNSETFKYWTSLAAITNLASLSRNPVIGFPMTDTRLKVASHPPAQSQPQCSGDELLQLISSWPPESECQPFSLLANRDRKLSQKQILSQKTIDKWRSQAPPGKTLPEAPLHNPIPVMLYALQNPNGSSSSWILMLPWQHVLPTWYSLVHTSLSGGGQPRMGGLHEQRQKSFEAGLPWFPGDFPSTASGWAWELSEREQRMKDWKKKPRSKRIDFSSLDLGYETKGELGQGWACDWEYLCDLKPYDSEMHKTSKAKGPPESSSGDDATDQRPHNCIPREPSPIASDSLILVSIAFCGRGHASACARIYRLPTETKQRTAWLDTASRKPKTEPQPQPHRNHRSHQRKAPAEEDADEAPRIPSAEDLVGFVTSGNYNLGEGHATAIGSIHLQRMQDAGDVNTCSGILDGWCIVREAGGAVSRLARWEQKPYSFSAP